MSLDVERLLRAWGRFCVVLMLVLVCAGNITNSFLLKWSFRDTQGLGEEPGYGLLDMMQGRSPKPFVYRSQLPQAMARVAEGLPAERRDALHAAITRLDSLHLSYFARVPAQDWTPVSALVFHMMYLFIVVATAAMLVTVFHLARLHGLPYGSALGLMVGFGFLYPLTFQSGGYYYDFAEQAGALLALYCFLRQRMGLATLLIALTALNKETFFLFPLALYALHPTERSLSHKLAWTALQTGLCLIARHGLMSGYADNPGELVEFHFWDNLRFWLDPASYLAFNNLVGKGIFTPRLQNPLMAIPLALYFWAAWHAAPAPHRRFLLWSLAMLTPLFVLFGYEDEFRNFSLAFPAMLLVALHGVRQFSDIFAPGQDGPRAG